jgi:uncharacterized protein (DUF433 family)
MKQPCEHIRIKENGKPVVAGRGIMVQFLSHFIDDPNWSVQRICEEYGLTPAQVYAAWSYYYDHKDEIDRQIAEDHEALRQL